MKNGHFTRTIFLFTGSWKSTSRSNFRREKKKLEATIWKNVLWTRNNLIVFCIKKKNNIKEGVINNNKKRVWVCPAWDKKCYECATNYRSLVKSQDFLWDCWLCMLCVFSIKKSHKIHYIKNLLKSRYFWTPRDIL